MKFQNLSIVQIVREIGRGGGINGVAYYLDKEWKKKGVFSQALTLGVKRDEGKKYKSIVLAKLLLIGEVVFFTIWGTLKAKKKFHHKNREVTLCHADVLYGDVYVNHGLHLAMMKSSGNMWALIFRNPFHIFLLLRERIRFSSNIHEVVVCFSEREKEIFAQTYPSSKSKVVVIPNGVNLDVFCPMPAVALEGLKRQLKIQDNQLNLIFIGHEFDRKGLRFAIESLSHLPDNVRLFVVGGGSSTKLRQYAKFAVQSQVGDRVEFLGKRSDVPKLINLCDIFVLPSFYETWALVGLEAMACGKPVLMCPVGGVSEYLDNGYNGFEISQSAQNIAEKISVLMSQPELLSRMGENARESAKLYSWERVSEQYLDLLLRVKKGRS